MKIIFTCLFFSAVLFASAQNTFKVRAFAPDYSYLDQLIQLSDGSFVGAGTIFYDPDTYPSDVYFLKTDAKGTVLASKAIDFSMYDFGGSIANTSDGGFVACGSKNSENSTGLTKFKADLTIQWQKNYLTAEGNASIKKIIQTADGGYLMVGDKNTTSSDSATTYIIKTDNAGTIQFSKGYLGHHHSYDVVATTDGNYAILGGTETSGKTDTAYLIKIKPDGSVIWSRNLYNKDQVTHVSALTSTSDGGIVVTGEVYTADSITGTDQTIMVKYNNAGTVLWSKTLITGKNSENVAFSVIEDRDGGYLFAGSLDIYENNADADTSYNYIIKTNASGELQWTKTLNPNVAGYTEINNLIKTTDGGYAVCGDGTFYNATDDDNEDGSFIYKYNINFLSCNDTSGSRGTIGNFSSGASITTTAVDITTTTAVTSKPLLDAGTTDNVCSNTLPLQLLSFNATLQNKSVAVQWTTANEINTSYFEVEKSKDAIAFKPMQKITAKGNNTNVQAYSITDLQPLPGTSYYRLKEIDKDEKITYSSVVPVTMLNNGSVIISPNPVQNEIRIVVQSSGNASLILQVIDVKGNLLATKKASLSTGRNEITIPAASLAKGVYVVKIIQNRSAQTIRFVKE